MRNAKDRPVGRPETVRDLAAMSKEELEEWQGLVKRANEGDEEAVPALREVMKKLSELAFSLVDFARAAENVLIGEVSKDDLVTREALRRQLAAMREEVAGPAPSPLERLLAERVVATWLQVQLFEGICASDIRNSATAQADYHQRHLDRAYRRHLSAVRTLAQVRKLLKPQAVVAQINIAEQQINTASGGLTSPS